MPAAALLLLIGGCGSGTSGTPTASGSSGPTWLRYAPGSATPTPGSATGSASPLPTGLLWTPLPTVSPCDINWEQYYGQVLIPVIVTPAKNSLKVQWPSRYGPNYRVAAVNQIIVTGTQPPPAWINVAAGAGCTTTATITGLTSGNPYIIWLDAPNTPRGVDNSRSLYSGRSGIVYPL